MKVMLSTTYLYKKPKEMNKQELLDSMNYLQPKIDSGRTTGAEIQILKECCDIYIEKYEEKSEIMPNPENSRIDEIAKVQTDSQIEELRQEIEKLKQENKELRKQLKTNPPSPTNNLKMDLRDI